MVNKPLCFGELQQAGGKKVWTYENFEASLKSIVSLSQFMTSFHVNSLNFECLD